MEVTTELRKLLKEKRDQLGYSIKDLVEKTIPIGSDKPTISISTISSIERGDLKNIKQETFEVIAKVLGLEQIDDQVLGAPLKVAFGACLWASSLINGVVSEPFSNQPPISLNDLKLTCYADESGSPHYLSNYNQKPDEYKNAIFTANENLALLERGEIDVAFLPVMTAERANGIMRIARCMNTVKGGVYLFIIGKKGDENLDEEIGPNKFNYEKLNNIKEVLEYEGGKYGATKDEEEKVERCRFVFPKNSVAHIEIEQTLYNQTPYEKQTIDISTLNNFKEDMMSRINVFFDTSNKNAKYFIFAGWDYHVNQLHKMFEKDKELPIEDKEFPNLIFKQYDGYRFTKYGHPFAQISYDCVTLESKSDYVKSHVGLKTLLNLLNKSVKELNAVKHSKFNSRYRMIAEFLDMDKIFVNAVLRRINWEFSIYPEMYDKDLK